MRPIAIEPRPTCDTERDRNTQKETKKPTETERDQETHGKSNTERERDQERPRVT